MSQGYKKIHFFAALGAIASEKLAQLRFVTRSHCSVRFLLTVKFKFLFPGKQPTCLTDFDLAANHKPFVLRNVLFPLFYAPIFLTSSFHFCSHACRCFVVLLYKRGMKNWLPALLPNAVLDETAAGCLSSIHNKKLALIWWKLNWFKKTGIFF